VDKHKVDVVVGVLLRVEHADELVDGQGGHSETLLEESLVSQQSSVAIKDRLS
jgi:hypothetical protein